MTEELTPKKEKLYISHFRKLGNKLFPMSFIRDNKLTSYIEPVGGVVKVKIVRPDGTTSIGYSVCDDQDNFNRRIGIEKAMKNALLNDAPINEPKKEPKGFLRLFGTLFEETNLVDHLSSAQHIKNVVRSKVRRLVDKNFQIMIE